jgi:hypothetical protein
MHATYFEMESDKTEEQSVRATETKQSTQQPNQKSQRDSRTKTPVLSFGDNAASNPGGTKCRHGVPLDSGRHDRGARASAGLKAYRLLPILRVALVAHAAEHIAKEKVEPQTDAA